MSFFCLLTTTQRRNDATTQLDAQFNIFVKFFFENCTSLCQAISLWFGTTNSKRFKSRRFLFTRCWMPYALACIGAQTSASCFALQTEDMVQSGQVSGALDDNHKCGLWIFNGKESVFWQCCSYRKMHAFRDYTPPGEVIQMLHGKPPDPSSRNEPIQIWAFRKNIIRIGDKQDKKNLL